MVWRAVWREGCARLLEADDCVCRILTLIYPCKQLQSVVANLTCHINISRSGAAELGNASCDLVHEDCS